MKSVILSLALFIGVTMNSSTQSISDNLKSALQSDNITNFKAELDDSNKDLCFKPGKSKYSLLAL